jgi:hypothetical protein
VIDKKQLLEDADKLAHYCDCQHHGNCAPCKAAWVLRGVAAGALVRAGVGTTGPRRYDP